MTRVGAVEPEEFARKELELHRRILAAVKEYYDGLLRELGALEDLRGDPSTYWALLLELARSIYVSYGYERRRRGRP